MELDKFLLSVERPDYPWEGPFQLWTDEGARKNLFYKLINKIALFCRRDYPAHVCYDYADDARQILARLGSILLTDWKLEWKSSVCGFEGTIFGRAFDHWIRLIPNGWASEEDIYIDFHPFRDRTWVLLHVYERDFWIKPD